MGTNAVTNASPIGKFVAGLEIKTAQSAKDWEDDSENIPVHYWMQCQWYCGLMRLLGHPIDTWYLAVLIHGAQYKEYAIKFDQGFFDGAVERAVEFWHDHVLTMEAPEVDGSDSAKDYLAKKHANADKEQMIVPTIADTELIQEFFAIKDTIAAHELIKDTLEQKIMSIIGDKKGAALPDGRKLNWVRTAPTESVSYKEVVKAANVSPEIIKQFTKMGSGKSYLKIG